MEPAKIQRFKDEVAQIAASRNMRMRAVAICRSRLGSATYGYGEIQFIAEDGLNEAAAKLLGFLRKDKNCERLRWMLEPTEKNIHPIAAYLAKSVARHCTNRSLRWLPHPKTGQLGARARVVIGADVDETEFWDKHLESTESDIDPRDIDKVDALLIQRGLNEDEIFYLKRRLQGWSWVELAEAHGGSADKYRRLVERACKRTSLEFKKVYRGVDPSAHSD